jgi:Iron-containing redox enzyme
MDDCGIHADMTVEFDGHRSERLAYLERCDDRELFYFLINYEADPDMVCAAYDRIQASLAEVPADDRLPSEVPRDGSAVEECLKTLPEASPQFEVQGDDQAIELIRQYAPTALLEACWLQNICGAATCHTEVAAHLFGIYAGCIGQGEAAAHAGNRSCSLLRRFGIDLPAVTTLAFSEHPELLDAAFHAPVVQLCLSLLPRALLPEMIGFTLAYAYEEPVWLQLCSLQPDLTAGLPMRASVDLARRQAGLALQAYLDGCEAGSRQTGWQRIRRGFALYRWVQLDLSKPLKERLSEQSSPRDKMITLLRDKVLYAHGHHRDARIGGKRIDAWFSEDPFDEEGFLDALAQSEFVAPKAPLKSRLLTDLTSFGGPMFRIFNKKERAIILAWLESLSDQNQPASAKPAAPRRPSASRTYAVVARANDRDRSRESTDTRKMFYRLVNSDLFPDILPAAKRIVSRQLSKSAAGLTKRLPPLRQFFPYTHGAFQARIEELYEKELDAYRAFEPPPRLSREVYVWGIEQLAPTVLVDGCWLQNIAQGGSSHSRLAVALFGIYADEVGNGHTRFNHSNVYRRLLQSLSIDLPPLNDPTFAAYTGFLEAAFDLPVYLLAISHFPRTFLPEIIGLNLAIELSGLGARYMRLVDELDHWGIDSTIIRLHISIDNMAGGHAAIARDVVKLYLDQVVACSGEAVMQQHWRRIWTGFLSLNSVSKRFGLALLWHYGTRFAMPQWYRRMAGTLFIPGAPR